MYGPKSNSISKYVFKAESTEYRHMCQLNIDFNACVKESESNTPKCNFSRGGGDSNPPPPCGTQAMLGLWAIGLRHCRKFNIY